MNTQPVSVDISELISRLESSASEGGEHSRELADAAHALRRSLQQSAIHDEAVELRTAVACRDLVLGEHLGESDLALDVMYNRAIDDAVGAIEQHYQFGEESPKSTFFH
ncbi:hypothetical protein [Naasia lichenicola]|uniref:Uncharacterized protein n=1 Tax=Naasia lichenicola TaxID=2565933 RepID=A0A4S4FJ10_9MICO|nr:hypothetical protein [Naasia lichenicola]THG29832.1 hypothetical protein E6C64_14355 [Naasia lichenicola]